MSADASLTHRGPWFPDKIRTMVQTGGHTHPERVTAALSDVDTTGWTQRFDLLSDPNRLEDPSPW